MKYLIVDTANTFFRARHSAHRQSDTWDKLGFAVHVTLSSVNKAWRDHKADHVVFCLEGRSWRKDFYEPYKKNRAVARQALTEAQAEEDTLFWEAFDSLKTFLDEKTNCTVVRHSNLEADDLIAGWVQAHPDDEHVIVSSDTDFHQLLASNVQQYNGVADELHTLEGIFDKRGKYLSHNGYCLKSVCVVIAQIMCLVHTQVCARKALRIKLVYLKHLKIEIRKALIGTT